MGRFKLKPIHPIMLPIRKNDFVLFEKELYKVIAVSREAQYTIKRVKDEVVTSHIFEGGFVVGPIRAGHLTKITNKAARVLYGV